MEVKKNKLKLKDISKYGSELISIEEKIIKVPQMIVTKINQPIILYGYKNESNDLLEVYYLKDSGELGEMITEKCGIIKAANSTDWILITPVNHNLMARYFVKYYRLAKVEVSAFKSGNKVIYIKEYL